MTELLFGLTVIFLGYFIYEVLKTVSDVETASRPASKSSLQPAAEAASATAEAVTEPTKAQPDAPPRSARNFPAPPKPAAERGASFRNPATGEIAAVPTNYRFAKKWIKEALVAEGLLDRIYKPGELDDAVSRKVKEALDKLRILDKYRP